MSIWEDPRVKVGRLKFEQIGDRVRGRITRLSVYEGQQNGYEVALAEVQSRQLGVAESKPDGGFIATAANLVGQLQTLKPTTGDTIDVELTDLRKVAMGTAKIFRVDVVGGAKPDPFAAAPAAPSSAPTPPPSSSDDPFA